MNKSLLTSFLLFLSAGSYAQGTLSGDIQTNVNFFIKDTSIKACCNELYEHYLTGSETWVSLRYNVSGWTFNVRGDVFNNSNLYSPQKALSGYGLGAYSVSKEMGDLTVSLGYLYEQIGSGILFRSYEDRGLLIDNALVGASLKYKVNDHINVKAFTGQQKTLFSTYKPIIRGFNAEGDFGKGSVHFSPGLGVLNRALDQASMDVIAGSINAMPDTAMRFNPKYNVFAATVYNTLTYKNFMWYVEGAVKSSEAIWNINDSLLVNKPGNVIYTTMSWGKKGIAINAAAKRTENFYMRVSPNDRLLNSGMLNWQPVVATIRPERLLSRYTPASQDRSEAAGSVNVVVSPNDKLNVIGAYTHIDRLDGQKLFREGYLEGNYTGLDKWIIQLGLQYMEYNQKVYQVSFPEGMPMIYAFTPFTEVTYRLSDSKSMRFEVQYMDTKQDYGSWTFLLAEFNVAPKFSISVSDMYNNNPNYKNVNVTKANHYYSVYGAFTKGPHRLSLAYVKQVDGINCSGGVCRYEPAFSGVKATFSTNF